MAEQVTMVLQAANQPDPNVRKPAEAQLNQAKESNYPVFMMSMVTELATEGKPNETRMLAALLMKNSLFAKDDKQREINQQRWLATDVNTTTQIKAGCLQALCSPISDIRQQAAQVVSKIGLAELPNNRWPELVEQLKSHVIAPAGDASAAHAKHGSLVALGFLCQEVSEAESDCLAEQANSILTAVIQGLRQEEQDMEIKYAAVKALGNAIEFVSGNFEKKEERDYIMTHICQATQCPDQRIRKEAMDCLAQIAYYYYQHLSDYMQPIANLTMTAIKSDQEEVGIVAMEFWSTLVEEEINLSEQLADGQQIEGQLFNFTQQATQTFLPVLLECMTKAGEDDEDEWTLAKAAAVCLQLFARCAQDAVVDLVKAFIAANFVNPNPVLQDAAALAFGSILEGPSQAILGPLVQECIPLFIQKVTDKAVPVNLRDTCAWVLASILDYCPDSVPPVQLQNLLTAFVESLNAEVRVAVHICYAIQKLAEYVEDKLEEENPVQTPLSPFTKALFEGLVQCSNREDADETANEHELFTCAYTALSDLVRVSGTDQNALLKMMVPLVIQKLSWALQDNAAKAVFMNNVQGQCCGLLGELCKKLPLELLRENCDNMMNGFLAVYRVNNSEVREEALMAIATLARVCGSNFAHYMDAVMEVLKDALDQNNEDRQVCAAAVGLVGDLSRALEKNFLKHCDDIMLRLLQLLMSEKLHRDVKPPILSTFADIALAISGDFTRFLEHSMTMLYNASQIELNSEEEEDIEYLATLHENILEGYSGIVQALRDADKMQNCQNFTAHLMKYRENIFFLIEKKIVAKNEQEHDVLKAAISLVGDLAQARPDFKASLKQQHWVGQLLNAARQAEVDAEDIQFTEMNLR